MNNFYLLIWYGGYDQPSLTAAPTFENANKVFNEWSCEAEHEEDQIDVYYVYEEPLTHVVLFEQLICYSSEDGDGWYLHPIDESKFK